MSDYPQTPEAVALRLLEYIVCKKIQTGIDMFTLRERDKTLHDTNKDWILQTYAECLDAVGVSGSNSAG